MKNHLKINYLTLKHIRTHTHVILATFKLAFNHLFLGERDRGCDPLSGLHTMPDRLREDKVANKCQICIHTVLSRNPDVMKPH